VNATVKVGLYLAVRLTSKMDSTAGETAKVGAESKKVMGPTLQLKPKQSTEVTVDEGMIETASKKLVEMMVR
jgi:hypothetical protein